MTDPLDTGVVRKTTWQTVVSTRIKEVFRSPIVLSIWFCAAVLAIVAQPFETYGLFPFWARVIYWTVLIGVSIVVGNLADAIAVWMTPSGNPVRASAKAIVFNTGVLAPLVIYWSTLFSYFFPEMTAPPLKISFYVFVTSGAVFVLLAAIRPRLMPPDDSTIVSAYQEPAPDRPRLVERLQRRDVDIFRLSANDHLIEVVTDQGSEHIRIRFADAVKEMHPLEGCCVHRSHWVALHAVVRLERRKDKLFVLLTNGDEIPVSRTYRAELEAAMPELF